MYIVHQASTEKISISLHDIYVLRIPAKYLNYLFGIIWTNITELTSRKIAAFSYFFDLAAEHDLVQEGATDAVVKVEDYIKVAKKACDFGGGEHRFACMDLTFISTLLTTGYGLPLEKEMQLYKKINGHEASWALGLAYNLLEAKWL